MKRRLGVLLIFLGLVAVGLVVYHAIDPLAGLRQRQAQSQLYKNWGSPSPTLIPITSPTCVPIEKPPIGQVFGIIQIPAFGPHWKFTIVEGTDLPQLATGPGHTSGTPFPGQKGNVGIAAHDVTAGNPFLHLSNLRSGDPIVVTTRDCITTYKVYRAPYTVLYTDIGVLNPIGNKNTITLVTCTPVNVLYFVTHRTIVQGEEISSVPR
jgi:LPXTG-site transpeptidase (sortase) family protein